MSFSGTQHFFDGVLHKINGLTFVSNDGTEIWYNHGKIR